MHCGPSQWGCSNRPRLDKKSDHAMEIALVEIEDGREAP